VEQLNARYATDGFNHVDLDLVRRLATCCESRCEVARPDAVVPWTSVDGFRSRLVACAVEAARSR
jgi:hypothetical protein